VLYTNGSLNCPTYEKGTKGKYQLVVSDKSWNKLKQNIKPLTRKTTSLSIARRIHKLKTGLQRMAQLLPYGKYNRTNSKTLIAGYATGCATVFGLPRGEETGA
jgi:hypothetical protein